jgi:hypothetical protein
MMGRHFGGQNGIASGVEVKNPVTKIRWVEIMSGRRFEGSRATVVELKGAFIKRVHSRSNIQLPRGLN